MSITSNHRTEKKWDIITLRYSALLWGTIAEASSRGRLPTNDEIYVLFESAVKKARESKDAEIKELESQVSRLKRTVGKIKETKDE